MCTEFDVDSLNSGSTELLSSLEHMPSPSTAPGTSNNVDVASARPVQLSSAADCALYGRYKLIHLYLAFKFSPLGGSHYSYGY
jgi:hypothetical protein